MGILLLWLNLIEMEDDERSVLDLLLRRDPADRPRFRGTDVKDEIAAAPPPRRVIRRAEPIDDPIPLANAPKEARDKRSF